MKIHRSHKIELKPNNVQRGYFKRACGIARFVFNWGLSEWKRQYEVGKKPSKYKLKKAVHDLPYDLGLKVSRAIKKACYLSTEHLSAKVKD